MKVILISATHGGSRCFELGRWSRALLSAWCIGLPLSLLVWGYQLGQISESRSLRVTALDSLKSELARQSADFQQLEARAEQRLKAMTTSLAELQARLTRLDALGEHLTAMADLEDGEFDFSQPPAVGGPLASEFDVEYSAGDLGSELDRFAEQVNDREQKLEVLASLLRNHQLQEQRWLSGMPVAQGYISSGFGRRTDPFTGKRTMHSGVDIAGRAGSPVQAVAAGVVTWTGRHSSYGNMVELSHGDGIVTRYAHNQSNLVEPGDVVRKGDPIALLGSSGRSTGAHVHYEVYKHGRPVDPSSYIARTRR